jgi:hypothetical protein
MNASIHTTPRAAQWSIIPAAWAASSAAGFSHRTCLPASAARIDHSAWRWFGNGT